MSKKRGDNNLANLLETERATTEKDALKNVKDEETKDAVKKAMNEPRFSAIFGGGRLEHVPDIHHPPEGVERAARAHSSSNWPPGAPLTPIPPMMLPPAMIATPPTA